MPYLLDTNVVLYHLAGIPEAEALVSRLAPDGISVSIITYMETYQSTLRSSDRERAEAELAAFLSSVPVLPFAQSTARRCASIREQLAQDGKRVRQRALDLLIAATVLEYGLMLVTRNRDDFGDIPGLEALLRSLTGRVTAPFLPYNDLHTRYSDRGWVSSPHGLWL